MAFPAGLVRGALERPEEDAPRLVFADWLEENGESLADRARGELIRVQCELARWVPDLDGRAALQGRAAELLAAHQTDWLGGPRAPWRAGCIVRGMARVSIEARRLAARAFTAPRNDWLSRAAVEWLRPVNYPRSPAGVASAVGLRGVAGLDLSDLGLTDAHLEPLLASPHLGGLIALDLSNNQLTGDSVARLAASADRFPALARLDLRNNSCSGNYFHALLDSPLGERLAWLELHGNEYDPAGLDAWRVGGLAPTPAAPRRMLNSAGMEFACLPAGTFLMGSPDDEPDRFDNEGPTHRVTLSPFWAGVYPVTQGQFRLVTGAEPSSLARDAWRRDDYPVEGVTWNAASEFCRLLGARPAEKSARRTYRLLTEAEWEYACRAGSTTPFHFGAACGGAECNFDTEETYGGARRVRRLNRTSRVGSYPPNAFGLYDLHGNVQEWVADWYGPYLPRPCADPVGPATGEMRVLRGGSWFVNATRCRSARRNRFYPDSGNDNYGFRVVLVQG